MVTKKTRLMSGLVAVLMLVSMFTAFVIPVSAASGEALVDGKGSLPNIATDYKSGTKAYQVNSREGLEQMAIIMFNNSEEFTGVEFWQTADIDMGWESFRGIGGNGGKGSSFRGIFDGNGFVIKNLYIGEPGKGIKAAASSNNYRGGLFNQTYNSCVLRNIGISSGLVFGRNYAGVLVGYGTNTQIINCWNAATFIGGPDTDGAAPLAGYLTSSSKVVNSYNLGLVYRRYTQVSQLVGWINTSTTYLKNCYAAGHSVSAPLSESFVNTNNQLPGYQMLVRADATARDYPNTANNYYVKNASGLKSYQDAYNEGVKYNGTTAIYNVDEATGVEEADLANGELVKKLNSGDLSEGNRDGYYTVQYVQSEKGYPVLEYTKANGTKISRTAEEGATNVAENTWAKKSALFKAVSERVNGGLLTSPLGDVHIKDANDLFALAVLGASMSTKQVASTGNYFLDADIDMAEQEMVPGLKYMVPLFSNHTFDGTFDGQNHKIDNLNIKIYEWTKQYYSLTDGKTGFFGQLNGTVKNLHLASGTIEMVNLTGAERNVGGISAQVSGVIYNSRVSLTVKMDSNYSDSGASGFGRNYGVIDSCISDATLITNGNHASHFADWGNGKIYNSFAVSTGLHPESRSYKDGLARHSSAVMGNVYAVGLLSDKTSAAIQTASRLLKKEAYANGELAWKLNSNHTDNGKSLAQVFYTVEEGKTVFGTSANQTRKLTYKNGDATYSVYVNAGTKVTLDHPGLINETFGAPSAGTVENGVLTMPASDVTVEITNYTGLDLTALVVAIEKWEVRNANYYAEVGGAKLADTFATAKAAYAATLSGAAGAYADQTAINNAVTALNAFEGKYNTYPNIPRASEYVDYSDAKNFLIKDEFDLAAVNEYRDYFTASLTVELANDITVTESNLRARLWSNVHANIDGHGYAIKNMTLDNTNGWLGSYKGSFIKNLTLDGWTGTNLTWQGALLIYSPTNTALTIENVKAINCKAVSTTETGNTNGLGILVGIIPTDGITVTMKNITVEGCSMDYNGVAGNAGFVVGRVRKGTLNVDGLFMSGNKVEKAQKGSNGLVFGEMTGSATVKNVIIKDTIYGSGASVNAAVVAVYKKSTETADTHNASLNLENILVVDSGNYPLVRTNTSVDLTSSPLTIGDAVFTDADKIGAGNELEQDNTMTAGELDALYAAGGVAAKFNSNTESYLWTMKNGELAVGDATNAIRTVAAVKDFGSGTENVETYLKVGEKYTVAEIANYSLKENSGYTIGQVITVANQDYAIPYELTGVETKPVEDIIADLGRYDMNLFVNDGADMVAVLAEAKAALVQAEAALASGDKAQIKAANDAVQAVWAKYEANVTAEDRVLKGAYPYLPGYADIDVYKDLTGYDAKNLAISDRDDWIAAVKEGAKNFSGITLHLTGNIDMKNDATDLKPLGFGASFNGVLDGHDYAFTNFKMEMKATASTHHAGLIHTVGASGVVKNVGIANGSLTFEYTANADGCSFGAIAGTMSGGGTIQHCWNAASVTVTVPAGHSGGYARVAGIVGAGYSNSIVDGCYNAGTVTSPGHAAGINDWAQNAGHVYNSFNVGVLNAGNTSLVRHNEKTATSGVHSNIYALGSKLVGDASDTIQAAYNVAPYSNMDPAAYASGELAWYLNTGYQEDYGAKYYWTVEDGKTIHGTADNQTVRVVLNFENREDEYIYLNKNDATAELSITYGEAEGNNKPIFTPAEGELSTISGSTLTYNAADGDVEVNVTFDGNGIDYVNLLKVYEAWGDRNSDYYAKNAEDETLAEVRDAAMAKYVAGTFANQAEVEAVVAKVEAFEYAGYPNLPVASEYEKYTGAPGYLIKTNADLVAAGRNSAKFTAEQTLYLEADLDLTGVAFGGFKDLKASFEGNEHTISNFTMETLIAPLYNDATKDTGFFMDFYGAYIKNLTMKNAKVSTDNRDIAVLVSTNKSKDITIENVHLVDCTVTLKNKLYDANSISGLLGVSDAGSGVVNITNCTVKGSTIASVEGAKSAGNLGFVIGVARSGATFNITDVLVEDSTLGTVGVGAAGFAIGAIEGSGHVNMNNVGVLNNKRINSKLSWQNRGLVIGYLKDKAEIDLNNIVILGNDQDIANQVEGSAIGNDWNVAFNMEGGSSAANLADSTYANIYSDEKYIANDTSYGTPGDLYYSVTADQYGAIAFAMNNVGTTQKWEVVDGEMAVDTDGEGLPVKVEFKLADVGYEIKKDVEDVTVYTDSEGAPVGLAPEVIEGLKEAAAWPAELDFNGPFTADAAYVGAPYPTHNAQHQTHLEKDVDGIHHYIVCDHAEEGGAVCDHSEKVDCAFEYESLSAEGTKPEDAKHHLICDCGNKQAETSCEFDVVTDPATPTEEGSITSTCKYCGYTHVKTLIKLVGITVEADKAYVGETGEVLVKLSNNPGFSGAVVEIEYDSDLMTLEDAVLLLPENVPGGENGQQVQMNSTAPDADGMVITTITFAIYGTHDQENFLKLTYSYKEDAVPEGDLSVKAPLEIRVPDISTFDFEEFDVTTFTGEIEIFDVVYGDIDDDKIVTILDAILMLRYINGDQNLEAVAPDINLVAADIDDDGEVEIAEVVTVLQYLNHSIDKIERA